MTWRDRFLDWRDRRIADPRFQRWAAAFPPTRPAAAKNARALFDLCAGFVYSQTLYACVELKVFDLLKDGPLALSRIAAALSLNEAAASRLAKAAASLRLLSDRGGGRYGLGELGAAVLGNPSLAAMIAHHAHLYADLADPVALLRKRRSDTRLARYWSYPAAAAPAGLEASAVSAYSDLMAASQAFIADQVLAACPLTDHRRLLDIGGGEGAFLAAAAARYPNLRVTLFDLPAVAALASQRFAKAGLGTRAEAVGGDFLRDGLPAGADIASLVRVLHDHDDAAAQTLLAAARKALPAGGKLLIAEPMAGVPGAEPIGDAYFGLYLWAMGSGRPRRAQELIRMTRDAGFRSAQIVPTRMPILVSAIVAQA